VAVKMDIRTITLLLPVDDRERLCLGRDAGQRSVKEEATGGPVTHIPMDKTESPTSERLAGVHRPSRRGPH